jgi:hypothetical protein
MFEVAFIEHAVESGARELAGRRGGIGHDATVSPARSRHHCLALTRGAVRSHRARRVSRQRASLALTDGGRR